MRIKTIVSLTCFSLLLLCLHASNAFPAEKQLVRFGVNLRFNPITMYERYQPMLDYLTQNTPYRFELRVSRDYQETIRFLSEGKIDFCSIGDGGLMKAVLLHGAVPIVKPLNEEGKPYYRSVFVVRANSPIQSLQDLKGKRLALGYKHSTTGNLIPRAMLLKNGMRLDQLASVTNLRHHGEVARAVLNGDFDAGAVKESTAIRYQKKGLRIVACSETLPSIPLVARQGTSKELTDAITSALVKLSPSNPQHRRITENWDVEYKNGFVPATSGDYRKVMGMFRKVPYGCGAGCHR